MSINPCKKPIAYFSKYQKKTKKSHYQSLLADELLILWGCWSGSHEPVKYTPAYFVLLPSNWFVSIWS